MIKGSCACGRVQYQVEAQPLAVNACHCITCQRASGGPFLAFVDFQTTDVKWTQQPDIWQASDVAERGYCKACGSAISMRYFLEGDRIAVTMGTITEAEPTLPPLGAHIFLKNKASYLVLAEDGVDRYEEFPGDLGEKLEQWRSQQKA